jgi:hypothetical protein
MSQKIIEMSDIKLTQLRYESETWKRLLEFMMDENIQLKYRLSDVLKNNFDKQFLEQLENFQSSFVKEDNLISVLRNDVAELDKLLSWEVVEDVKLMKELDKKMKLTRNNITNAETQFSQLKSAFISYLSENM